MPILLLFAALWQPALADDDEPDPVHDNQPVEEPPWVKPGACTSTERYTCPVLIRRQVPGFPPTAKARKLARESRGQVDCRFRLHVDDTGQVQEVELVACPQPFHRATILAGKRWRYDPALDGGVPCSFEIVAIFRFVWDR